VWDRAAMAGALTGISVPISFAALLLQYVLVVQLQIRPFPQSVPFSEDPVAWLQSYIMPWLVLALGYASVYARIVRANVIDTLQEDYLRTARAKGLSAGLVIRRHALRPSLTPVVTLFGMDFAGLLGGAVITETVFGLNGVGKLAAAFVVVGNVVVDVLYTVLDPRVRITA
jgi:peptide/nickel transport system permease protein